jgi:hypothetical protein
MVTSMHQNVTDYDSVNDVVSRNKFNFVVFDVVAVDAKQPP